MKAYVRLIAAFLGISHRLAFQLLTDEQQECVLVEALVNRAVRL